VSLFAKIPIELRQHSQWVCWRHEKRDGKFTKIPFNARTGTPASTIGPATWSSFDEAVAAYGRDGYSGIGFVFCKDDPFTGVDLDHIRDPKTGAVESWARDLVKRLNSYAELSQSGTGTHVIIRAKVPGDRRRKSMGNNGQGVEVYDSGRYFCMTGLHLAGTPATVEDRQAVLSELHAEFFGAIEKANTPPALVASAPLSLSDAQLLEKAQGAKNGALFSALWRGDWQGAGYTSQSDADAALLGMLRFWTGGDKDRSFRLFDASGLSRGKWVARPDYRERTWATVAAGDVYSPAQPVTIGGKSERHTVAPIENEDPDLVLAKWPDPPKPEAFYGVFGEFIRRIDPHTESDLMGLLIQLLVGFGNVLGRTAYFQVEADKHYPNLNAAIVGNSSKARKGTSWGHVYKLLRLVDPTWPKHLSGLSTGEGLIYSVRDATKKLKDGDEELVDAGVTDKPYSSSNQSLAGRSSAQAAKAIRSRQ
jgi:hypothetical protein